VSKKRYILALDEGTSSARAVLFDVKLNKIAAIDKRPFKQIYPKAGWVEHNPKTIWQALRACLFEVATNIDAEEIFAIGITNQRETVVMWDSVTGDPVYNAIVWQDRRTADYCSEIQQNKELLETIRKKTGLGISSYFSASKIRWILRNVPLAQALLKQDRLLAGTIDTYIVWKLTKGKSFITDPSNASRTLLFNINTLDWDDDLLNLFGIPRKILPSVVPTSGELATTQILGYPLPIASIVGDQQASLFGQGCFSEGEIKNTYGTGCFLLANLGNKPRFSKNKLLTTVAWQIGDKTTYALEGGVFNTGSAVQWLRDELGMLSSSAESEKFACSVEDTNGVYFVPAFSGLGAPWWDADARAMFMGLTRGANKSHLVRAVLEAIAYASADVFGVMAKDTGFDMKTICVDGGASENNFMMQFQADILGIKVVRSGETESTALGAIYLAGLGVGAYSSFAEIKKLKDTSETFIPKMKQSRRDELLAGWAKAIKMAMLK